MKNLKAPYYIALSVVCIILCMKTIQAEDIIAAGPPDPLSTFELPPFITTLADEEPRFLKMTIVLGYEDSPELKKELTQRKQEIRHIINILLQNKKYADLDTVSDAIDFSEEIKSHINSRLMSGKIKEIYFKEFIIN